MQPCHNCQAVIDEYLLDKQLEPLRELTVDDFNLCTDCTTVGPDACAECDGAVYVPRTATETPDICPACRADRLKRTGTDPGWTADASSA